MPAAAAEQTPQLSPEQRLAALFEEKGETAMDGNTDIETRVPDEAVQAQPDTGPTEPALSSPEADIPESADDENEGAESVTGDEPEGSQEQEGIEAGVLAEVLGIDEERVAVDEEGRPLFAVKVDGQGRTVPLSELIDGYAGQEVFTRKSQELSQERQTFEQQRQQELQTLTLRAQAVDQVLQEHQQEILNQYEKEDWDTLRTSRPDEYAARRTEYAELYQKMEQRRQYAQQAVADLHQQEQQKYQAWRQQTAQEEGQRLRAAVAEWDTDEKASQGAKAIQDFLLNTYGLTEQDLADTLNHRAYLVALDAMRFRLQQKQDEPLRKRIVKAPRVLKPGKPSTEADRQRVPAARVVKRHKSEKSVESAAEAFLAKNIV